MSVWIIAGVCVSVCVFFAVLLLGSRSMRTELESSGTSAPPPLKLTPAFSADDMEEIRFTPTLRGYAPAEVDGVLTQLTQRLREVESQLEQSGNSTGNGAIEAVHTPPVPDEPSAGPGVDAGADERVNAADAGTPEGGSQHP